MLTYIISYSFIPKPFASNPLSPPFFHSLSTLSSITHFHFYGIVTNRPFKYASHNFCIHHIQLPSNFYPKPCSKSAFCSSIWSSSSPSVSVNHLVVTESVYWKQLTFTYHIRPPAISTILILSKIATFVFTYFTYTFIAILLRSYH